MMRQVWPFVMGSVALGLDAYVIAGLLPAIATSLGSKEATVGLGVATFTGCYAIFGPVLAGRAGRGSRRSLIIALGVFTIANVVTILASSVAMFLIARSVAGVQRACTRRCRPQWPPRWRLLSSAGGLSHWCSPV